MERQKRIAMGVHLCALVGIGVVWSSAGAKSTLAPSICSRLVTQMRGSPATVLKDQSVPKMLPWIVSAVSRPAEGEPDPVRYVARRLFDREGLPSGGPVWLRESSVA